MTVKHLGQDWRMRQLKSRKSRESVIETAEDAPSSNPGNVAHPIPDMNAREDYYAKVKSQKKQSKGRRKNIEKVYSKHWERSRVISVTINGKKVRAPGYLRVRGSLNTPGFSHHELSAFSLFSSAFSPTYPR